MTSIVEFLFLFLAPEVQTKKNSRRKNSKVKEKLDNSRVKHKDSTKFQYKKSEYGQK